MARLETRRNIVSLGEIKTTNGRETVVVHSSLGS